MAELVRAQPSDGEFRFQVLALAHNPDDTHATVVERAQKYLEFVRPAN